MLTLPDFKEKKILFIHFNRSDKENSLKFRADNIRLYKNGEFVEQISCYSVLAIYIIGTTSITTSLIKEAKLYGITMFLLTTNLKTYASINAVAEGNYHLRGVQYSLSDEVSLDFAKQIVINKISNQYQRITGKSQKKSVATMKKKILQAQTLDVVRGFEGVVASEYFKVVFSTLKWRRRAPRTREDIPNLLLDIGYSLLFNFVDSLLLLFGFDTYKGVYHKLFFQRKSLTCDLMEPMRPIIDKQLIKSFNLRQVNEKDFKFKNGSFYIKDWDCRKKYVAIFLDVLMDNKVMVYEYVIGYYRHVLNPKDYPFPQFIIT